MNRLAVGTVFVVACAASALTGSGLLEPVQRAIDDSRFALTPRAPTGSLVEVDIDEASIQALGVWPWSRATHAAILDKLKVLGAADVAFDIDFSSRSPAGDDALEAALKRAGDTTILAALQQSQGAGSDGPAILESHPLDRFSAHAWEASVNVRPDPDGRLRSIAQEQLFEAGPMPTLAALLAGEPGTAKTPFLIDYGIDARRLTHVSAIDLLRDKVDAATVAGRKVIVGATAMALRDVYQVPRFGFLPGATVQALAVESLVQGRALQPTSPLSTLIVSALVLLIVGFGALRLPFLGRLMIYAVAALTAEIVALGCQAEWPVVPVTAPLQAGFAAFGMVAIGAEIVGRRKKLRAARHRARRLAATLDRVIADNFAGIVVVDQDGIVRAVSTVAARLLGPPLAHAVGQPFQAVLHETLATLLAEMVALAQSGHSLPAGTRELRCPDRHGAQKLLECVATVSALVEEGGSGSKPEFAVCLTFQDITEKRATEAELARMAHVDFLSGLANRFVLLAALERRGRDGMTAGLLLLDLDRFKLVNDRFGHAAGDSLIQAVATRLVARGEPGDVVARLGGDEFAVFAKRCNGDELLGLAEGLVRDVGGAYEIEGARISVGVSAGLALDEGQAVKDFMAAADAALFAAKAGGGDRVQVFDGAMRRQAEETKRLEQDLREALERCEFSLVYQRQVDVRSGEILGVEALVRWHHPEYGAISPAVFIPVAERTGLIEPLGAWILADACRAAVAWPLPIKVSVNLSAVQLARPDLAAEVLTILAETGLDPRRLDLELTESLLMEDDALTRSTLNRLREVGIGIALDDFGTGYSSLSYLRTFRIDKVKIDQSFVRDLNNVSSGAIVRAVVGLSLDLGLRINAEGVETREQLDLLRALGCHEVQGYLHGRPEPSSAIAADLDRQRDSQRWQAEAAA